MNSPTRYQSNLGRFVTLSHTGPMLAKMAPLVIFAVFALAGCGHKASANLAPSETETSADLPAGWKLLKAKNDPISIGLPPAWISVDMSVDSFNKSLNANTSSRLSNQRGVAKDAAANNQYKLIFRSTVLADGRHATGVIMQVHLKSETNLHKQSLANADYLRKTGVKVDVSASDLPAGPSELLRYDALSQDTLLTHLSYCLMQKGDFYIVGFSFPLGDVNDEQLANQMAKTFRIGG